MWGRGGRALRGTGWALTRYWSRTRCRVVKVHFIIDTTFSGFTELFVSASKDQEDDYGYEQTKSQEHIENRWDNLNKRQW
jgi:hypothetical protein